MKKIIFASTLLLTANFAEAARYDDWEKVTVNITQAVQHFGGQYTCAYNQKLHGLNIFTGRIEFYQVQKFHSTYIPDSLTARPAVTVQDLAILPDYNGLPFPYEYYNYRCDGTTNLAKTYIEQKVVGTKIEYRPIAPFPTYTQYEFLSCANYTRNGSLMIGGATGASNMVVKDITGNTPITIYSGPSSSYINFSTSSYGGRELSIKLDSGSSYYQSVYVPPCTPGGGGGVQPL